MKAAGLQDVFWVVGACVTGAVRSVRQPKSMQVEAQSAVSRAQPKDHNLLVNSVCWVVVCDENVILGPRLVLADHFGSCA